MRTIASISGGEGSWLAARVHIDRHGAQGFEALFTDTLFEDQDTYRFLIAGAANLFGITLPAGFLPEIADFPAWEDRPAYKAFVLGLALRTMRLIPGFHWIADGRDPWDVFEHERFLGNSRVDPCSKILKRQMADRWHAENCDPAETQIIVGLDHEEPERFHGMPEFGRAGLRARKAEAGWTFIAPLLDKPWVLPTERRAMIAAAGLWQQRLSVLGFAHSNCGGFCCKAGQGHWNLMLQVFPERYDYSEYREQEIRSVLGDVSMLTDRRKHPGDTKTIKRPLTLATLRSRVLRPDEAAEMGGCRCALGDVA